MPNAQQELEEYFAREHTNKYVEFGGQFDNAPGIHFFGARMQNYFSSGRYLELGDPYLEDLWRKARREKFAQRSAIIVFSIGLILIAWILTDANT